MGLKTSSKSRKSAKRSELEKVLSAQIQASHLPGEPPLEGEHLRDAINFILDTGMQRDKERSAIALSSVSIGHRILRIAIINDDMPFLVDSVAATICAHGLTIERLVHPVVPVERDGEGRLIAINDSRAPAPSDTIGSESVIYLETERADARQRRELEKALRTTLADVRAAVRDWPRMQLAMQEDAGHTTDHEGAALLEWLQDGMLTQLGHVVRKRNGKQSGALGICRKSAKHLLSDSSYERAFAWFDNANANEVKAPLIIKANHLSNVHRRVPLDLFIVPWFAQGELSALSVHAGVWTSAALASPPVEVPKLRADLATLMQKFGFDANGHAGKALAHALTALPHDLILGFADADIERVAMTMMSLVDRPRPSLSLVRTALKRHLLAFVWLPRDTLSTEIRRRVTAMLEESTGAHLLDWSLQVEGGNLAMLRFVFDMRGATTQTREKEVERRLIEMLRGWGEALEAELGTYEDTGRAAALAVRFADLFPEAYRMLYGPAEAARDIKRIRRALATDNARTDGPVRLRDARLFRLEDDPDNQLRLKIYEYLGALPLSDAVPALENFGFRVLGEYPTSLGGGNYGTIHDFTLELTDGAYAKEILDRADTIEAAISAVLNKQAEDDPFNRLVISAGLSAQESGWLRAFYRYLRQAGMGFTIYTVVDALSRASNVTVAIVTLFRALHDPDHGDSRETTANSARDAIKQALMSVSAINDDRLLRLYHALVEGILRTNSFAPAGQEALAFKIESECIPDLPKPIPWREVFVYSRRVEGIHLRAGPVARGGLRWSDRRDDFRTEILGLMKAQRVKNAVIVPTGAKGGFYPKQLPPPDKDREAWAAEGQASYEVFIRSLLSVTDNLDGNTVLPPLRVVRRDGDDPYFVVAADKGTARFSDVANGIAEAQDFWLGDAFASGGSNGYDHKAMGITARGAWVSVQRHFLEMGVDVQSDPVLVAGCGDMSGDVFGNGMLLSKSIRLVAAFDHRHIFIDPSPDAATGWKERKRLFGLRRSSWDDYDKSLISKGGGVYSRGLKSIKLSAAARKALGIEASELDPDSLISAVLAAPVDLFWFGGIGTYIKAAEENNIQVGDPANDTIRIDANQVRAKVIGEGANLGITQAGRIGFALDGGRLNTDFIDNSAGVDCSDNEVNIKVALATARRTRRLSAKSRNALLADMTDEVAELVLEDNRLQALAISIAEMGGAKATAAQLHLIETLEELGALDRQTEGLVDSETLTRRANDDIGLTRPELAVLLSSTKLVLQDAIENSALPDDPLLEPALIGYFPTQMQKKFRTQILEHRLRRDIIATDLANKIVNRLGLVHPFELAEEEGVGLADVAAAFVAADALFDLDGFWERIDSAKMPETAKLTLFEHVAAAVRIQMADVLRAGGTQIPPSQLVEQLRDGVNTIAKNTDTLLAPQSQEQSNSLQSLLEKMGVPRDLASQAAYLFALDGSVGVAELARSVAIEPRLLASAFTDLGARLGLDWAQGTAALMNPSDVWERLLVAGLAREFQQMRLEFLKRLSRKKGAKTDPGSAIAAWSENRAAAIRQFRMMIQRAQSRPPVSVTMLAQIASQARNLLGR